MNKKDETIIKCVICDKPLKGRQTLYCSDRCMGCGWYRNNRQKALECQKKSRYKMRYSLTIDEYNNMMTAQDGKCAICHLEKKLNIDHDHMTGKARGLLCHKCNTTLAYLESATSAHWRYLGGER